MNNDDPILQAALDRIQVIVEERRRLEEFVTTYRSLKCSALPVTDASPAVEPEPIPARPPPQAASTEVIVNTVMKILEARRAPMKLAEIYNELTARGVVVGGKVPRNNLGAKLSAEPRLKTHKDFGWWFASDAYPDARLDDDEYEEGLNADALRPLQSNGAADLHSA